MGIKPFFYFIAHIFFLKQPYIFLLHGFGGAARRGGARHGAARPGAWFVEAQRACRRKWNSVKGYNPLFGV